MASVDQRILDEQFRRNREQNTALISSLVEKAKTTGSFERQKELVEEGKKKRAKRTKAIQSFTDDPLGGFLSLFGARNAQAGDQATAPAIAPAAPVAPEDDADVQTKIKNPDGSELTLKEKASQIGRSFNIFDTTKEGQANLNPGAKLAQQILSFTGVGMKRAQEFQRFGELTEKDKGTLASSTFANTKPSEGDALLSSLDPEGFARNQAITDPLRAKSGTIIKDLLSDRSSTVGAGLPGRVKNVAAFAQQLSGLNQEQVEASIRQRLANGDLDMTQAKQAFNIWDQLNPEVS